MKTQNESEFQEDWDAALQLVANSDGEGAVFVFRRIADAGSVKAAVQLGRLFELGVGSQEPDPEKAIEWYGRAIQVADELVAHAGIARVYLENKKFDPGYKKATSHLEVLRNEKVPCGSYGLGLIHLHGVFEPADKDRAKQFFEEAGDLGHLEAKLELAYLLFEERKLAGFFELLRVSRAVKKERKNNPYSGLVGLEFPIGADAVISQEILSKEM